MRHPLLFICMLACMYQYDHSKTLWVSWSRFYFQDSIPCARYGLRLKLDSSERWPSIWWRGSSATHRPGSPILQITIKFEHCFIVHGMMFSLLMILVILWQLELYHVIIQRLSFLPRKSHPKIDELKEIIREVLKAPVFSSAPALQVMLSAR